MRLSRCWTFAGRCEFTIICYESKTDGKGALSIIHFYLLTLKKKLSYCILSLWLIKYGLKQLRVWFYFVSFVRQNLLKTSRSFTSPYRRRQRTVREFRTRKQHHPIRLLRSCSLAKPNENKNYKRNQSFRRVQVLVYEGLPEGTSGLLITLTMSLVLVFLSENTMISMIDLILQVRN